jgi:hypothetical protein
MSAQHLAMLWTERAIALAVVLQTIELLQLRAAFSDTGIWRWRILSGEHAVLPRVLRAVFAVLLPYRGFVSLLWLRLAAALALLLSSASWLLPWLWLSQIAIGVRFRGTFNGGSDSMTALILFAASVAVLTGGHPLVTRACLAYIAVQLTLSYFIAGVAKSKQASWRSGEALRAFVAAPQYNAPRWLARWLDEPAIARVLARAVLAFECAFPLAWLTPTAALGFSLVGLGFHIANVWVFGLNRFVYAWAAAYPALWYGSLLASG